MYTLILITKFLESRPLRVTAATNTIVPGFWDDAAAETAGKKWVEAMKLDVSCGARFTYVVFAMNAPDTSTKESS